ncbi:MAG TPA: permease [candidate division Zixibacteria bacterium]
MTFSQILLSGWNALLEYLSAHVLTCLVPAFFIAGAISALLPKEHITKHLGPEAPRPKAYLFSVMAGLLLAVCSCTVLPLFAGIKKKGAGIGPAIAFLYTAPATNILAILFTGSVLGWDFAFSRIVLSIGFAVLTGIIISGLFPHEEENCEPVESLLEEQKNLEGIKKMSLRQKIDELVRKKLLVFFVTLFAILIFGASKIEGGIKIPVLLGLIIVLLLQLKFRFQKEEILSWLTETYNFFKMIFPLLLIGIFVAGMLGAIFPRNYLGRYVGTNTLGSNLLAVLFGLFMYFPTLVEVPMAKMFLGLGVAKGPLLAYLLADPVISLPSILVVRKIMGSKRTLVYMILITAFCTLSGLIYGVFVK